MSHEATSPVRKFASCKSANAAVELPDKAHPARRVIEELKLGQRDRLAELARGAGLSEPEALADELYPLLEGARVIAQSIGAEGLGARLTQMGEAMIPVHLRLRLRLARLRGFCILYNHKA